LRAAAFVVAGDRASALSSVLGTPNETETSVSPEARREISTVASWLVRNSANVRILHVSGVWAFPARAHVHGIFDVASRPAAG
jgi:hypothetical protein